LAGSFVTVWCLWCVFSCVL